AWAARPQLPLSRLSPSRPEALLCLVWGALDCGSRVESNPHRAAPGERAGEVQHPPPGRVPACPRDQRSGNGVGGEYEQTHGEKVPSTQIAGHARNLLTSSRNGGDVARPDLGTLRAGRSPTRSDHRGSPQGSMVVFGISVQWVTTALPRR